MLEINCDWSDAGASADTTATAAASNDDANSATNPTLPLNLAQLIAELEERPVLYDRSLHYSAFGRTEVLRSWSEVAEQLGAGRTECLRAWKRLLQTFVCLQQTSERLLAQWPFYALMRFVEAYARNE